MYRCDDGEVELGQQVGTSKWKGDANQEGLELVKRLESIRRPDSGDFLTDVVRGER
jgi:hypothetical protein